MDLVGKRFGRRVVLKRAPDRKIGVSKFQIKRAWVCRCDCGKEQIVSGTTLAQGMGKSCGCLISDTHRKHGRYRTETYKIWAGMKSRCLRKKHESYKNYGGRGIKVCKRWMKFENFLADMGERPRGLSIDRINVSGNYERKNCRWATAKEQANNKRKVRLITHDGVTMSFNQWCRLRNLSYMALHARLVRGWSFGDAISTPQRNRI